MAKRDKLAQCRHKRRSEGPRWFKQCADCGQLLSLGGADEPKADIAAGRMIALRGGLADGEDLYELPLGSHRITTGDQGDAWAWRVDRTIAEQLAETARDDAETSARVGPVRCDWHAEHGADDRPTGQRCEAPATRGTMRPADGAGEGGPVDQVAAQATAIVDVPAPGGAREVLTADLAPREPNVNAALATVGPLYTTEEAEQLNVQFEQSEDGCGNVELIPIPGVDGELG